MTKLGAFWIPDVDAQPGRNLERSRFGFERGHGVQIAHLERALQWVPGRTVAVDGGANVGAWTRLMAAHFSRVHAFEPNPAVFECLERNVEEWGIRDRVVLHAQGLSDRAGFAVLAIAQGARTVTGRLVRRAGVAHEKGAGREAGSVGGRAVGNRCHSAGWKPALPLSGRMPELPAGWKPAMPLSGKMPELLAGASPAGGGDIECVTIDSLDLAQCAFLKLDVEGHEARALAGARQTLVRCAPWVLIENKPARREGQPGGGAAERMLADCGYELVEKIGADEIDWLFRPGEANDRPA